MDDPDDRRTADSALEFPCEFPIKMMGRDTPEFRAAAREIVEQHAGPVSDGAFRTALSRKANFVSITVSINASSQAQLDAIYQDLSAHEQILVAL